VNEAESAQLKVRLPGDLKKWVEKESGINGSSQNSEIIRALRERQQRSATATGKESTP